MADCNFSIEFPGPAEQIVGKVREQIQRQGGSFNGDASGGSFNVKVVGSTIAGSYNVAGSQINISITDKPFFLSCGQIESFLRSQLGS